MSWTAWFKRSSGSLLIRLLLGYLAVIALLLSFHFLSIYTLKDKFQSKLINYNQLNLQSTVEKYEDTLLAAKNIMLSLYYKEPVAYLHAELLSGNRDISQTNVKMIHTLLRETIQANPHLHLENVFLYAQNPDVVISREGISEASLMLGKYMDNERTQPDLWSGIFADDTPFRLVPAVLLGLSEQQKRTDTFALIVKNSYMPKLYFIAFVRVDEAFKSYHHPFEGDFWIKDAENRYFTALGPTKLVPALGTEPQGVIHERNSHFLYRTGEVSNLTYIDRIPDDSIQAEVSRLYLVLMLILLAALFISICISVLFSVSIHNPIKRFVQSMQQFNWHDTGKSNIKEFRFISEQLADFASRQQIADRELSESKSLLTHYAYHNKLKAIKTRLPSTIQLDFEQTPFVFVLTAIHFRVWTRLQDEPSPEQAAAYLREFLQLSLSQTFTDTLTFPMEQDQLASIVFLGDADRELLLDKLSALADVLNLDKEYYTVTIGVSSVYRHSSELTDAYREATAYTGFRRLDAYAQIIASPQSRSEVQLTSLQDQELQGHILSGNREATVLWLQRLIHQLNAHEAFADEYRQVAGHLIQRVKQIARAQKLEETPAIDPHLNEWTSICTVEEFENMLTGLLVSLIELVQSKKDKQDMLVEYVRNYLESHYHEDVSLDLLADRLKMTGGYLSTYFKEKSGINFKDYLTDIRMNKAKALLLHTDKKVQEIAESVGYPNHTSFIRMFRKTTGLTPGEYRRQSIEEGPD